MNNVNDNDDSINYYIPNPPPSYSSSIYPTVDDHYTEQLIFIPINHPHVLQKKSYLEHIPYSRVTLRFIRQYHRTAIDRSFSHDQSSRDENTSEILVDESLERISNSLQQLIDEAQTSLQTDHRRRSSSVSTSTTTSDTPTDQPMEVDGSYQYIQHRYHQSQEKIFKAFQQLDESIQGIYGSISTISDSSLYTNRISHGYKTLFTIRDRPDKGNKKTRYLLCFFGSIVAMVAYKLFPRRSHSYLIIMALLSIYRRIRKSRLDPVMNIMDRILVRHTMKHESTPSIVNQIHCTNVGYQILRIMRLCNMIWI
ncbi:hypothetical protein BDB01DRAFT_848488 [Pilobolus umbonatus]|nr:hypothetical protein BDB01DRAFT_848488 [Pilobolus umbonatus]